MFFIKKVFYYTFIIILILFLLINICLSCLLIFQADKHILKAQFREQTLLAISKMNADSVLRAEDYILYSRIFNTITYYKSNYQCFDENIYDNFKTIFYRKHFEQACKLLECDSYYIGMGMYSSKYDIAIGGRVDGVYTFYVYDCIIRGKLLFLCPKPYVNNKPYRRSIFNLNK